MQADTTDRLANPSYHCYLMINKGVGVNRRIYGCLSLGHLSFTRNFAATSEQQADGHKWCLNEEQTQS